MNLKTQLTNLLSEANKGLLPVYQRDILRYIIGQVQLEEGRGKKVNDEWIIKVIKKLVKSNNETYKLCKMRHEIRGDIKQENEFLQGFLPNELTDEEFLGRLLNSDGSEYEQIQNCEVHNKAMGIAIRFVRENKLCVAVNTVLETVSYIRKCNETL